MKLAREGHVRYLRVVSLRSSTAVWHVSFHQGRGGGRLREAQLLGIHEFEGKKEYK